MLNVLVVRPGGVILLLCAFSLLSFPNVFNEYEFYSGGWKYIHTERPSFRTTETVSGRRQEPGTQIQGRRGCPHCQGVPVARPRRAVRSLPVRPFPEEPWEVPVLLGPLFHRPCSLMSGVLAALSPCDSSPLSPMCRIFFHGTTLPLQDLPCRLAAVAHGRGVLAGGCPCSCAHNAANLMA